MSATKSKSNYRKLDKRKKKLQLYVLHDVLDLLEYDRGNPKSPISGPVKLYAMMLAQILIRGLRTHGVKLNRSSRRARQLGIAVNFNEVPEHEKQLLRPKIKRKRLYPDYRFLVYWDDDEDDDDGVCA